MWALGQRLSNQNIDTPLKEMKPTIEYGTLSNMKKHLSKIAKKIKQKGFHSSISPVVIGIAGYGNVSNGAQEILDLFPVETISPSKLGTLSSHASNHCIYKVVFTEEDMVKHNVHKDAFNLQEYYKYPEKYHSVFHTYVPHLTALINCIYWDERYPRLISKEFITHNYAPNFKLQVIGDISVDINGSIEFTEKITTPDNPCFIYHPPTDSITDGLFGEGIAVLAIDNLPCELPGESSHMFSETLLKFIPLVVNTDFRTNFQKCNLPPEIKRAVILYHGKLTPDYQYIDKFL
jgi:alpha-aminoadipic semialdehyde synthase